MREPSELRQKPYWNARVLLADLGRNTNGIREVPTSVPGRDGDCPDHGFIWFSSLCLGKCRGGTSKYTALDTDMVVT
jgi:hypothetical protein